MPPPTTSVLFSSSIPGAPSGDQIATPQTDTSLPPFQFVNFIPERATASRYGTVKPDGDTITVDGEGTISVASSGGLLTPAQIQDQDFVYAADTGSANAYAVDLSPAPSLVAGSVCVFKASNANTGASTLSLNGGSAIAIKKQGSTALASGDIAAGQIVEVVYDGSNFQMLAGAGGGGAVTSLTTTGSSGAATLSSGVLNIPIYSGGGGGGGATFGTRASLPGTVPAAGSLYICSDSPYSYISDGTSWHGMINGRVVGDPSLDSSYVTLHSGTFTSTTVSTAAGGIVLAGVASGDHVLAYAKPVTPSSTLRISLAWLNSGQGGPVIWNANTGNIVFLRLTGGLLPGVLIATLHYSRYNVTTGEVANEGSAGNFSMLAPLTGYLGVWFDGTNWYTQLFLDALLTMPVGTGVILSEALATWIGTNYTHVGFGVNNGAAGAATMWGQHLNIVST